MGIRIEDFLDHYFRVDELKDPLEDIGLPVSGTKNERIDRILKNWASHNRDWYELLDFLDWEALSQICDDFSISYNENASEETLCNKIKDDRVLDFRKKQKSTIQKKSDEKPSTVNILGKNINVSSNNKIQFESKKENRSLLKASLIVAIVVGAFVIFGVVSEISSSSNPTKNEFSPTEGFTVETDAGPVPIPQDIRGTDEAKIYPIGDVIKENTVVSNSYGFVISVPNDNWEISYTPTKVLASNTTSLVFLRNEYTDEKIIVSKIENIPKDFELLMEEKINNHYLDNNGYNFKEYFVEENGSKVYSFIYYSCNDDGCRDFIHISILKVVDSDLFHVWGTSNITDKIFESFTISPDMYEILNSFRII